MNFDKFGENLGEGTKEVINELEARRIARAREAGLPDDSTEEDIKTAELEARRIARAREVGLPDDSTEEDIKTADWEMKKIAAERPQTLVHPEDEDFVHWKMEMIKKLGYPLDTNLGDIDAAEIMKALKIKIRI